jgi:urease accessory protein
LNDLFDQPILKKRLMNTHSLIQGLRFVDSFFPSGGFAFSSGLEAAVKGKAVQDGKDLARYVEDALVHGIGRREAVAVALVHQAAMANKLDTILNVDRELDSLKIGRDSRLASRQMGRQVVKVTAEQLLNKLLLDYRLALEEGRTPGHFPVAMGMTLGACCWSCRDTVAAFLYQTAQGFVSAAMKLLPLGQQEGQHLLARWEPLIADVSHRVLSQEALTSWSPVQDIYAMRHARLESRLFRS